MANTQTQRQKQEQHLSPQQLILIRLLQTPVAALEQAVKEEIEKNPLLEDENIGTDSPSDSPSAEPENDEPEPLDFEDRIIDPFGDDDDDMDYRYSDSYGSNHSPDDPDGDYRLGLLTGERSLGSYLAEQLAMRNLSDRERAIGMELIGSIDASGYLGRHTGLIANDMAFKHGIEASPDEVERVLHLVQSLDPPGVGGRDLRECLALQLHRLPKADYNAVEIVDHYFDDFSAGRYELLMDRLAMTRQQLEEAMACIRSLNPKPGSAFAEAKSEVAQTLLPDFIVNTLPDGTLELELNEGDLPQLRLSRYYCDMARTLEHKPHPSPADQETVRFLREKATSAQWFIDMLGQRRRTLRRIMEAILDYQRPYFLTGLSTDLRPMRLQDIAEPAGFDISTVSRVVNQKWVQTFFGTFLLKELFTHGVADSEGREVSADAVKEALLAIVEQEDKHAPLTDDELAARMKAQGFPLARRTVAKYREALGIPVRRLRKKI